jgi:hypothetical protein
MRSLQRRSRGIRLRGGYRSGARPILRYLHSHRQILHRPLCLRMETAGWQGPVVPSAHGHGFAPGSDEVVRFRVPLAPHYPDF